MRYVSIALFLVVAALLGVVGWQNLPTRVNMVFKVTPDLAWDLGAQGQPLVFLLGGALLAGLVLSAVLFGGRAMKAGAEARRLRREVNQLQDELEFHKGSASPR